MKKKILCTLAGMALAMTLFLSVPARTWADHYWFDDLYEDGDVVQTGWVQDSTGWLYKDERGNPVEDQWMTLGGIEYYFDFDGYMTTGWKEIDQRWYYFNEDGSMAEGWMLLGGSWYYFTNNGAAVQWNEINGKWYYFDCYSGQMLTGWYYDRMKYYYLDDTSGAMAASEWKSIGGKWYYFDEKGLMASGWRNVGGKWYYLDQYYGDMKTGWCKESLSWYYMDENGVMQTGWQMLGGKWYYFDDSGAMATGWTVVGTVWYYFYPDGAMAADCWIDNSYVDASGAYVKTVTATQISFHRYETSYNEFAVITGLSSTGEYVWSYTTESLERSQYERISPGEINNGIYYYRMDGAMCAIRVSNGEVIY